MADYQSLLTRAVANLPPSSPASARQAIYDRARKALVTQLRSLRPPLPESDILREETALDHAIAAVEAKFVSPESTEPAHAAPPPAVEPPPQAAVEPPQPAAPPASLAVAAAPREASVGAARATIAPRAPIPPPAPRAAAPAPRPAAARPLPARPSAPAAAGCPTAPTPSAKPNIAPRAETGASGPPPVQAPSQDAEGGAAPPVIAAPVIAPTVETPAAANLSAVAPGAQAQPIEATEAPPIVASRADEAEGAAPALQTPIEGERVVPARPEIEGLRPAAPSEPEERRRSWPWAALAVVLGIVLSVALAAIAMRQKPQDLAINPPAGSAPEAQQAPAKIAHRAESSPAEDKSAPAQPAQNPGQAQTPQPATEGAAPANSPQEGQAGGQLPGVARAAMLVASADNPTPGQPLKPVVNLGSTVWSTIPAPQGQPAAVAVEADADIPDLKMRASMILRKNTDPTLQATHTIDLKFTFQDGAPFNGFKDVGLPQMRKLDSSGSEALGSVKVKIADDYFLFALTKSDQDLARNLDLMRSGAWFDFPLLLNDNRIAKLVFQKSADGEAMLEKAFDAWK